MNTNLDLKNEVMLLRSFVIGIAGKDKEGEYKPEFVNRIFKALKEKSEFKFTDSKHFLTQLDNTL